MTAVVSAPGATRTDRTPWSGSRSAPGTRTSLVFCWADGKPINPARVTKQFERHSAKAGLPRTRLHALRHGWGSHAIAGGVDIRTVSARLDHASASFTLDRHVHEVVGAQAAAALLRLRVLALVQGCGAGTRTPTT